MGKIVAIGGGEIGRPGYSFETLEIDKEIIKLSGKKFPKLLFIPTASSDSSGYIEVVNNYFGKKLGCTVDSLLLFNEALTKKQIENKILSADIIYVGGGNTLKMMRRWRYLSVDRLLKKAYDQGVVLSGLSAGAVCWFEYAHSDSMSFYSKDWDYVRVKGLGIVPFILCPHYDKEKRDKHFHKMILHKGGRGIALDNCCAIEIIDDTYRIIFSNNTAKAYKVFKKAGKIIQEEIKQANKLQDINNLFT